MKKVIIVLLVVWGAFYYVGHHYDLNDTLKWAKKNRQSPWAPKVDYYVGLIYYQRSQFGPAQEAFTQLLTDFPTAQYAPKALIRMADAAESNLNWEAAKGALSRYLEEYPEGQDLEIAKKRLDILKYQHP